MSKLRPIVLTGPSGTGKSTLLARAMEEYPNAFAFSVSHTTRKPRPNEIPGRHYHFVDRVDMEAMIHNNEFIEWAEFGNNLYGTSHRAVADIARTGRICILDLDLTGVQSLKEQQVDAKYILVKAPSLLILEERLRRRGTESEEAIQKRLMHAQADDLVMRDQPTLFDKVIVNDVFEVAYTEFMRAIREELEALHTQPSNAAA